MPRTSVIRPYRWLAQYYDEIFSSFRFPIDAARERVLGRILPQVETACALDLSPLMCRLAREKAGRARLPVRVFRADMRHFRLPQSVDLVTCEYDALNHVPRRADLRFVAKAVQRALRPG